MTRSFGLPLARSNACHLQILRLSTICRFLSEKSYTTRPFCWGNKVSLIILSPLYDEDDFVSIVWWWFCHHGDDDDDDDDVDDDTLALFPCNPCFFFKSSQVFHKLQTSLKTQRSSGGIHTGCGCATRTILTTLSSICLSLVIHTCTTRIGWFFSDGNTPKNLTAGSPFLWMVWKMVWNPFQTSILSFELRTFWHYSLLYVFV